MKRKLFISHSLYLDTKDVDYLLTGKELKTTGICVPVSFDGTRTSEPAKEVFCEYSLKIDNLGFSSTKRGFKIRLSNTQLLNIKKTKFLNLIHRDENKLHILNQIVISDKEDLDRSMYFDQFDQTSSN